MTPLGHALERFNFRKHTLAQGRIHTQLRMVIPANLYDTQAAHDDKEAIGAVGDVDYRLERFAKSFGSIPLTREAHVDFKKRVPHAIGLIRTGDPTPYGNIILESV